MVMGYKSLLRSLDVYYRTFHCRMSYRHHVLVLLDLSTSGFILVSRLRLHVRLPHERVRFFAPSLSSKTRYMLQLRANCRWASYGSG